MPQPTAAASGPLLVPCAGLPLASTTREGALGREAPTMKDNNDSEGDTARFEGGPPPLLNAHPWPGPERLLFLLPEAGLRQLKMGSRARGGLSSSSLGSLPHQLLW